MKDKNIRENSQTGKNVGSAPAPKSDMPLSRGVLGESNRRIFGMFIAALVLIAVIAVIAVLVSRMTNSDSSSEDTYSASRATVFNVFDNIEGERVFIDSTSPVGARTTDGSLVYDFAPFKTDGVGFKSLPEEGNGLGITLSADAANNQFEELTKLLKDEKYTEKSSSKMDAGGLLSMENERLISYRVFVSDESVCSLAHIDATQTVTANHIIGLGCADIDSYEQEASAVASVEKASVARRDGNDSSLVVSLLTTEQGTDGYSRAIVYESSSEDNKPTINYYYAGMNADQWTYATTLKDDGTTNCSTYNSDILKKAFAGVSCYDEAVQSESVVRL